MKREREGYNDRDFDERIYNPEENPWEFRINLYEMIDFWEKNKDVKTKKEFFASLRKKEIDKYFGKYSKPLIFYANNWEREIEFTIKVLDGKIFSITETFRGSDTWTVEKTSIKKVLKLYIYNKGIKKYNKFLSCLCKEELEKYFKPSYLPK